MILWSGLGSVNFHKKGMGAVGLYTHNFWLPQCYDLTTRP